MMIRIKVNHMQKDANLAEIEMLKAEELEALFSIEDGNAASPSVE